VVEKVIIIGSGPAGCAAAIYAARARLSPLLFEGAIGSDTGMLPGGQLMTTTEVENYPGFPFANLGAYLEAALPEERRQFLPPHKGHGVSGPELVALMRQQAVNFGTRMVQDDVASIDLSKRPFKLVTVEGKTHETHSVIIATGARANYLGLPSEETYMNRGVSACAVCDGALPRFSNRPLVVVGGGDTAMEEASYLTKFGSKVYIVHRRDKFRASKIMADRAIANHKIEVKWNSVVEEILGNDQDGVNAVRIAHVDDPQQTETLEVGGYFSAIGHTPNTAFLKGQLQTDDKGYIVWTTPQRSYTSVEGVFASGDVADSYYRQAITAAGTGCMASLDAERWLAANGIE